MQGQVCSKSNSSTEMVFFFYRVYIQNFCHAASQDSIAYPVDYHIHLLWDHFSAVAVSGSLFCSDLSAISVSITHKYMEIILKVGSAPT